MTPDAELLAAFARTNSDDAFSMLVQRHVNLVYSAALRQVNGDAHLAYEVAQMVFADLARKARPLSKRQSLTGWLYTSTHFAATKIVRAETRRRKREEDFMTEPARHSQSEPDADWELIKPSLDNAMHELKEADREAILLRFDENRLFAEVGAKLGLGENAARMRVERALEKLRTIFGRRGVAGSVAFATAISAHAVEAAPDGFATTLTSASVATVGVGSFTLFKVMTVPQIKLALGAIIVAGATTALVIQHQEQRKLSGENESLRQQLGGLESDNQDLSNRLASANSQSVDASQLNELLQLRGQIGVLRRLTNELGSLRAENRRLQVAQTTQRNDTRQTVTDALELERQANIAKMNNARQGAIGFIMFAGDNQGASPTNFSQVARYLNADDLGQIETNYDLAYFGALGRIANPSEVIIFKEKQAWQSLEGKWFKTYSFADGHSELHSEPDGNFEEYEKQHSPPVVGP